MEQPETGCCENHCEGANLNYFHQDPLPFGVLPEAMVPVAAAALKGAAARHKLKPAQVMMPLRALVAATPSTPAIDAVLALLGRDKVRARIASGLRLPG